MKAVKDMAANIERRWRQLLEGHKSGEDGTQGGSRHSVVLKTDLLTFFWCDLLSTDAKAKKRKTTEPTQSKATGPPAKKQATGASAGPKPAPTLAAAVSATPVKKEKKPTVAATPAVKDAKSDSSFFSAPKPKPKLPTFKKAPALASSTTNFAQPSAIDPFQEALTAMKARKASPVTVVPTPPPSTTVVSTPGLTKSGKKKKSVAWRPDGESAVPGMLTQVKLIERAVYDDDPKDVCVKLLASTRATLMSDQPNLGSTSYARYSRPGARRRSCASCAYIV